MSRRAIWRGLLGVGILLTSLLTTIQAVDTAPMPLHPQQQDTNHVVIPYSGRLTDPAGGAVATASTISALACMTIALPALCCGQRAGWRHDRKRHGHSPAWGQAAAAVRAPGHKGSLAGSSRAWPRRTEFAALEWRQALLPTAPAANIANTAPCAHDHTGESWAAGAANGLQVQAPPVMACMAGVQTISAFTAPAQTTGVDGLQWIASEFSWYGIEINSIAWAGVWENAGFTGVEATGAKGDGVLGITKDVAMPARPAFTAMPQAACFVVWWGRTAPGPTPVGH